ncbi:hypothetical protein PFISCL1PPCAC_16642, partial [Pristionchus fissidentatus]
RLWCMDAARHLLQTARLHYSLHRVGFSLVVSGTSGIHWHKILRICEVCRLVNHPAAAVECRLLLLLRPRRPSRAHTVEPALLRSGGAALHLLYRLLLQRIAIVYEGSEFLMFDQLSL